MRIFKQELSVFRGEDFCIDKVLKNPDGTPFVLSRSLPYPYILISVTDTLYQQEERYIKNYWLSLIDYPSFDNVEILNLRDLKQYMDEPEQLYHSFAEMSADLEDYGVMGYYKGKLIKITLDASRRERSFVYYNEGEGYKYYDKGWKNYEFRFIKRFSTEDTKEWNAQNYLYSIQLVAGNPIEHSSEEPIDITYARPILKPTKIMVKEFSQGGLL
jgi:hypothetical protein